ncbi:hypothetical protein AYX14_06243 [Cryptococcus neoformans]|nr:hypothetical protein AYX14_06243 [Cryptococcus neoformans var. grubii]
MRQTAQRAPLRRGNMIPSFCPTQISTAMTLHR